MSDQETSTLEPVFVKGKPVPAFAIAALPLVAPLQVPPSLLPLSPLSLMLSYVGPNLTH